MKSMIERVARAIETYRVSRADDYFDDEACARVAIEAMREPTRAMSDAGRDNNYMCYVDPAWRTMIDAALNEQVSG